MLLILLYIFILFVNYLQIVVDGINYYDEMITIAAIGLIVYYRDEWPKQAIDAKRMMICITLVLAIGAISTVLFHLQPQFAGVWRDFLAVSKFPVCYFAFSLYARHVNLKGVLRDIIHISKLFILLCFVLGVIAYIVRSPLNGILYRGERYGLPLYDMGFSHATFLVSLLFIIMSTLIADGLKKNWEYVLLGAMCVLFTLRSKPMLALIFLVLVIMVRMIVRRKRTMDMNALLLTPKFALIYFILQRDLRTKKMRCLFTKRNIIVASLILIIFTYFAAQSQIDTYIEYGEAAARGACYYYGADLANRYFPLGSGFCTFSSSLSGKYYSPLYYYYEISQMEGLTPDKYDYAADTFWPNIFSQYGWIGFACYLLMLYFVIRSVHKRFIPLSDQWIAGMLLLVYIFAAAFAEAILTNSTAVDYALALTLFIGNNHENSSAFGIFARRRSREIRGGFE